MEVMWSIGLETQSHRNLNHMSIKVLEGLSREVQKISHKRGTQRVNIDGRVKKEFTSIKHIYNQRYAS